MFGLFLSSLDHLRAAVGPVISCRAAESMRTRSFKRHHVGVLSEMRVSGVA